MNFHWFGHSGCKRAITFALSLMRGMKKTNTRATSLPSVRHVVLLVDQNIYWRLCMNSKINELSVKKTCGDVPAFLQERMNEFYVDRWGDLWKGRHIMRGRLPSSDDVQMVSNDYLNIEGNHEVRQAQINVLQDGGEGVLMSGVFLQGDNVQKRLER